MRGSMGPPGPPRAPARGPGPGVSGPPLGPPGARKLLHEEDLSFFPHVSREIQLLRPPPRESESRGPRETEAPETPREVEAEGDDAVPGGGSGGCGPGRGGPRRGGGRGLLVQRAYEKTDRAQKKPKLQKKNPVDREYPLRTLR